MERSPIHMELDIGTGKREIARSSPNCGNCAETKSLAIFIRY